MSAMNELFTVLEDEQPRLFELFPTDQKTVAVIPCTGSKLDHAAPAGELYTGSTFRPTLRAATIVADQVLILSALHGLVELGRVLEPYELKMGSPGSVTADRIRNQIAAFGIEKARLISFLPSAYRQKLSAAHDGELVDLYAGSRGIGDQKSIVRRIISGELKAAA